MRAHLQAGCEAFPVHPKGAQELFLSPGSESDERIEKARLLGLNVIVACSITDAKLRRRA